MRCTCLSAKGMLIGLGSTRAAPQPGRQELTNGARQDSRPTSPSTQYLRRIGALRELPGTVACRSSQTSRTDVAVPKKFPPEFKRDAVRVARRRDLSHAEVAADFDISVE